MTAVELRDNLHTLIDELNNESVLGTIYELLLSLRENENAPDFWDLLTDEQKEELEASFEESNDPRNLIPHEEVMRKSREWLKKTD